MRTRPMLHFCHTVPSETWWWRPDAKPKPLQQDLAVIFGARSALTELERPVDLDFRLEPSKVVAGVRIPCLAPGVLVSVALQNEQRAGRCHTTLSRAGAPPSWSTACGPVWLCRTWRRKTR